MLARTSFRFNKTVAGVEFAAGMAGQSRDDAGIGEMLESILKGDFHVGHI